MKEDLIFCPSFLLLPFVLGSGPWRRGTLQTEASDWPPAPPCRSASLAEAPEHPGISHNATGPPAAGRSARPPEDKVRQWTYKSISVKKKKMWEGHTWTWAQTDFRAARTRLLSEFHRRLVVSKSCSSAWVSVCLAALWIRPWPTALTCCSFGWMLSTCSLSTAWKKKHEQGYRQLIYLWMNEWMNGRKRQENRKRRTLFNEFIEIRRYLKNVKSYICMSTNVRIEATLY